MAIAPRHIVLVLSLVFLTACSSSRPRGAYLFYHPPPAPEVRQNWGRIVIASAPQEVAVKAQRPMGLGESVGAVSQTLVHQTDLAIRQLPWGEERVRAWVYVLPGLAAVSGVTGALLSTPVSVSKEYKRALAGAVSSMELSREWSRQIYEACRAGPFSNAVSLAENSAAEATPSADTLMEWNLKELSLIGPQTINPPLALHLLLEVRLVNLERQETIYQCEFEYAGRRRYVLGKWADANAALLHLELERLLPKLSQRVAVILCEEERVPFEHLYSVIRD